MSPAQYITLARPVLLTHIENSLYMLSEQYFKREIVIAPQVHNSHLLNVQTLTDSSVTFRTRRVFAYMETLLYCSPGRIDQGAWTVREIKKRTRGFEEKNSSLRVKGRKSEELVDKRNETNERSRASDPTGHNYVHARPKERLFLIRARDPKISIGSTETVTASPGPSSTCSERPLWVGSFQLEV
ncbi:uncharacterized protein LOC143353940 [Halictus rubicundus]|uniref:uncharacterized protein LOC143353940 n=1 Tax=Halictus rubicundus TaxID=77578 RepID=UPI004036D45C